MVKRKVTLHGPATLSVSLPLPWAKHYGIKKGDEMEVTEQGKNLIISAEGHPHLFKISLAINKLSPDIVSRLIAIIYQKGYDEARVKFNSDEIYAAIQGRVAELIGFEIIDQGKDYCVIQNISSKLEIDFDTLLRKAFLIVIENLKSALDYFRQGKADSLMKIALRDKEVNKFCYYCQRVLSKSYYTQEIEGYSLYHLIRVLESIGDQIKALSIFLARLERKNLFMIKIIQEAIAALEKTFSVFYNPKEETILEFFSIHDHFKGEIPGFIKKFNEDEIQCLLHLERIFDFARSFHILKSDASCQDG
ncbi:phosphate uptake regulator PhoU [Candidatus Woesearchaeota archaeon]|nr:phosphate uptake regulator PhoU [Candidatus Woesearchaeota archaeon]